MRAGFSLPGAAFAALLAFLLAQPHALSAQEAPGPRLGRYTVTFFSGPTRSPNFLHTLELLPGFRYRVYNTGDQVIGEGIYSFTGEKVTWESGYYKDEKYGGTFSVSGPRHQLHMKDRVYARNG